MTRTLSSSLALLALAAAPLSAQAWTSCSTGSMQTCASFEAFSFYDAATDQTQLTFHVQNLHFVRTVDGTSEYGGSILAQFGVLTPELDVVETNAPYAYDSNVDVKGDPGDYWSEDNSSSNRLGNVTWSLVAGSNGSNSEGGILSCEDPERNPASMSAYFRTCENGWVVFSITTRGAVDLDDVTLAWGVTSNSFDGESYQGTTEVVPEPITMVLFGSGLVGVGAAARKRKNGFDIETE